MIMNTQLKYVAPYPLIYAREGDSGMDVRSNNIEPRTIVSGQTVAINTGIYLEIPEGYECQVRPKSSLSAKGILSHFGTIDTGYRGEVIVVLSNINTNGYMHTVRYLDKVAQIVLVPIVQAQTIQVEDISVNTERGIGGFGSTGN